MRRLLLCSSLLSCVFSHIAFGQERDTNTRVSLDVYIDAGYGAYPLGGQNGLQPFSTVFPRQDQLALNVAQIGLHYKSKRIRGNFTLHYGDIMKATWDTDYNQIQEANAGIRLGKDIWLDAGFFATHIGTESFLPKNNFFVSTAVATYNEPFYQMGARLSYEGNQKLNAELWLLNGYNLFVDNNSAKSVGVLLSYHFTEFWSLTYTNLLGYEQPREVGYNAFRTYHNLYFNAQLGKFDLQLGSDVGTEKYSSDADSIPDGFLFNALLAARYHLTSSFSVSTRLEFFDDRSGFISGSFTDTRGNERGLRWQAITLSTAYTPDPKVYIRLEGRYGETPNNLPLFGNAQAENRRLGIFMSLGFMLDHDLL